MIRLVVYTLTLGVLGWAAVLVPLPLALLVPGGATSVPELVRIDGTETTPIDGQLELLTIRVDEPTLVETIVAAASPAEDLRWRRDVFPPGIEDAEYRRIQRQEFQGSFEVAAAVGLEQAGYEVAVSTRVVVQQVLPDAPSAGILTVGDEIVRLEGEPVSSAQELVERLGDAEIGERIELTVLRDGRRLDVEVTAGAVAGLDHPGLGIGVANLPEGIDLPFDVTLGDTRIGGPSAGMMFALTVYDLVSAEDLADGRHIAGTGTIGPDGQVGSIGGIQQKVFAALDAGAEIMLVPSSQLAEAATVAPPDLEVIGVATLGEAIAALSPDA